MKEIGYADIEDFLLEKRIGGAGRPVSAKTRANMKSALHQMPDFPEVPFEFGFMTCLEQKGQTALAKAAKNAFRQKRAQIPS